MKIDSHQHFWHFNTNDYSWMIDNMNKIKKDFLPSDLEKELAAIGFDGSIAVQARQINDETEWLLKLADKYPIIKGVIGWVDLISPLLEEQLNTYSKNKKLVGVSHVIHDEPDDDFMLREEFLNGIGTLKKYNLTYDILIFPQHLENAIKLVNMFPDQVFILDHIAKPNIKNRIISPWDEQIKALSLNDNVYCKVSGMVTKNDWQNWNTDDFKPYLDIVFSTFGTNRVIIGSDWPVCKVAGSYKSVMNIVIDYIKDFPKEEIDKIVGLNAMKAYNIKE